MQIGDTESRFDYSFNTQALNYVIRLSNCLSATIERGNRGVVLTPRQHGGGVRRGYSNASALPA